MYCFRDALCSSTLSLDVVFPHGSVAVPDVCVVYLYQSFDAVICSEDFSFMQFVRLCVFEPEVCNCTPSLLIEFRSLLR
jgi:hypothetical protein